MGLNVVVTGASGNVGTSLLTQLLDDPRIESVIGLARRIHQMPFPAVHWVSADVARSDLREVFDGADVVVHLAWAIQPSHRDDVLWSTNVAGSRRVMEAAADAGVTTIVYLSSIGAYGAGSDQESVDETWPVDGTATSFYGRHKATVEWFLDDFERTHPEIRVVRLRPALIFKREAATGIRQLFIGPLLPNRLLQPGALPLTPHVGGLSFQAVHSNDVAGAVVEAMHRDVHGAFNLAAEPFLSLKSIATHLEARTIEVPPRLLRLGVALTWRSHLQPTPPGWLDMAMAVPTISSGRAASELDWRSTHSATETLAELLTGMADGADFPTPPLTSRRFR